MQICGKLFAETNLIRIYAEPFRENIGFCRVLEKAGFAYEATMRCNEVKDGKLLDMVLYALIKEKLSGKFMKKVKTSITYETVLRNAKQHQVINFGCFHNKKEIYLHIDISIKIGLLISSGAVDFVVTGRSSGQTMILACNSLPGILCGYTQHRKMHFCSIRT